MGMSMSYLNLAVTHCDIKSKSGNFSEPQFYHLQKERNSCLRKVWDQKLCNSTFLLPHLDALQNRKPKEKNRNEKLGKKKVTLVNIKYPDGQ